MDKYALQEQIERTYSKSRINNLVKDSIIAGGAEEYIQAYTDAINDYMLTVGRHWESKNQRILTLYNNNKPEDLAISILTQALQLKGIEEIQATVGAVASRLSGFKDHIDAVRTAADLIDATNGLGVHSLIEPAKSPTGVLSIYSAFVMDDEVEEQIQRTMHLPPMIVPPCEIRDNFHSPWLTRSTQFVILNTFEYHHYEQRLDAINFSNSIALSLCEEMLELEEVPNKKLDTPEKITAFDLMCKVSSAVYSMMLKTGNKFYLPHFNCERGRKYAKGYQINTQGSEYKKAIIDFADKFTIDVPEHMRTD